MVEQSTERSIEYMKKRAFEIIDSTPMYQYKGSVSKLLGLTVEVKLPGLKGDTLSLLPLRNKLVVLDFGLLTTPEGKAYAEEMKAVYDKFKNRGVEIYQVCLDQNRLLWEEAAKQYGVTWKCVWDSESLQSRTAATWNVRSIPANYIINQNMEIVGKNLYGDRLADPQQVLVPRN